MTTYYKHGSKIEKRGKNIIPIVESYASSIYKDKEGYIIYLPHGIVCSAETKQAAIEIMEGHLFSEHWVTDLSIAKRRADKEVELRKSGKLKCSGKNYSKEKFKQCITEILQIF